MVRALSFPTLVAFGPRTSHPSANGAGGTQTALPAASSSPRLHESRSDDLEKDLTRVCHEGNTTIVTALCPVLFLVENFYHRISPSLRYFSLVPHQLDHPVELPEHGRVMVYPEFEEFNREFVGSHCLRICHRSQSPDQLAFCRFDPELVCDRLLGELFDDVECELIEFRVEKGPEEPRPPS